MMLPDRTSEKALNIAAPVLAGSPWWFPSLDRLSTIASELVPIATLCWVLFQFGLKVYDVWKHGTKEEKENTTE